MNLWAGITQEEEEEERHQEQLQWEEEEELVVVVVRGTQAKGNERRNIGKRKSILFHVRKWTPCWECFVVTHTSRSLWMARSVFFDTRHSIAFSILFLALRFLSGETMLTANILVRTDNTFSFFRVCSVLKGL